MAVKDFVEETKNLLKSFRDHPIAKAIEAEREAKRARAHEEAAIKRSRLKAEAAKICSEGRARVEAAEAKLKEYDRGRNAIVEEVRLARLAAQEASRHVESELRQVDAVLLESAHPAISPAIAYHHAEHEKLRKKEPIIDQATGEKFRDDTKELFVRSNVPAIVAGLSFHLDAIRKLEALRFESDVDVAQTIQALKDGAPDVNEISETVGRTSAARAFPPRTMSWEELDIQRLLGKVNHTLRR